MGHDHALHAGDELEFALEVEDEVADGVAAALRDGDVVGVFVDPGVESTVVTLAVGRSEADVANAMGAVAEDADEARFVMDRGSVNDLVADLERELAASRALAAHYQRTLTRISLTTDVRAADLVDWATTSLGRGAEPECICSFGDNWGCPIHDPDPGHWEAVQRARGTLR